MTSKRLTQVEVDRARRMKWWHEARFGMFVHWGLYSQIGRHEWCMTRERIPLKEYEALSRTWKPRPGAAREWARLAKQSGMKYMVMTTKHHEGYSLWDSQANPYNTVNSGPGRDLVREFVEACREYGLKCGLYYSLMDWHHPDGWKAGTNEAARRRFVDYTQALVRELMTQYGKIDILWYDVPRPMKTAEGWESRTMNRMVRRLQPDILINNRSYLPEDFGTPEEEIKAMKAGYSWEACMTFNEAWGYMPCTPDEDWQSAREVTKLLMQVSSAGGNLLLNVGPAPDGSIPPQAYERLAPVGTWLKINGDAAYGELRRADRPSGYRPPMFAGLTCKGNALYVWIYRWPGTKFVLAGMRNKLREATWLASGKALAFDQNSKRIIFTGAPRAMPDRLVGVSVLKLTFAGMPKMDIDINYVPAPY